MDMRDKQVYHNATLLEGFRKGNEQAFTAVYRLFYQSLCFFAMKIVEDGQEAEDIASDCFLKVWEKRDIFYELPVLKTYLYRAVRNSCINHQRKKARDQIKHAGFINGLDRDKTIIEHIILAELMRELHVSMDQLPPQRKRIFQLLFKEGKSVRVAAEELQLSVHTVNEHRTLGMRYLRKLMAAARLFCL